MTEKPWDEPPVQAWMKSVLEDMAPKLRASACSISLVPDNEGDVKFWVELGASIMMDKPIIAVVFHGRQVPEKLRLVADEVVVLEEGVSPEASAEFRAALERVLGE